jgi:ribosomal protein S18 acetylase RimI-like enzyme
MASPRIRSARLSDLDNLAVLEVQAGQLFRVVHMSDIANHVPDHQTLRRSQEQGLIWVAEEQGEIAGYVVATVLDGNAHIEQVSMAPDHARQGIGRLLIHQLRHGADATSDRPRA